MARCVLLLKENEKNSGKSRAGNPFGISRPELLILRFPIGFFHPCWQADWEVEILPARGLLKSGKCKKCRSLKLQKQGESSFTPRESWKPSYLLLLYSG